jgi:competence protein ComEC
MQKFIYIIFIFLVIILGMLFNLKKGKLEDREVYEDHENISTDYVKMTYLDIGQGDATFIEFPDGQQMLVDCSEDARVIEALGRVMPYYDKQIDYLMITHPDLDHYGGCTEVLKRFDVKNIVYTGMRKDYDDMWLEFWQAIEDEGGEYHEINSEDAWEIASTTLHFLYPDHPIKYSQNIPGLEKEVGANNTSIVFKLTYGDMDVLMTGDAEEELEEYLLTTYDEQLDVEALKIGHHGSGGSSIQEFVNITSPEYSFISCGAGNRFGHPSRRIIKRLERVSSTVWRTDLKSDIITMIYKDRIVVENN